MAFVHVIYGGNGTTPVDSGMPRVGEIYGVEPNGDLRWYRYNGNGEADPAGASNKWHPNSGNTIGRGWHTFLNIFACGDGTLFGVEPNGDLRWYQYNGTGESDPAGSSSRWHPNSRNIIGNGWQDFRFLCAKPYEGRSSVARPNNSAVYGVEKDGHLRWYRYLGSGQNDPSGGTGWAPNSRNVIGQGWSAGFHYMAGVSGVILLVEDDGDLRWYQYNGAGESDPTGSSGRWHPNSGNVIGRGWQSFRHIFGGSDGVGGLVIYGIEQNGDLRWYRYVGEGESDPAGASDKWHPNSGNTIGRGW